MPELPEVETIVRGLRRKTLKQPISKVKVNYPNIVVSPKALSTLLKKDSFKQIGRHGKYITITTKKGTRLIIHLRMTGQLVLAGNGYKADKHVHLEVDFKNGQKLFYRDIRKFGRWVVVPPHKEFKDLINAGRDALSLTKDELADKILRHSTMKLKAFLLDQTILAGIGNIYADEVCYALKVDPELKVKKVNIDRLHKEINRILNLAIRNKGTSVSDYLTSKGAKGNFQNLLKVYKQKKCPGCGAVLKRKKVAGRTSHYCAKCQKR
ncbi:DNA-formamidopyrimidine glycosylase [Candidatus Margulisiibacteriota bacterium]